MPADAAGAPVKRALICLRYGIGDVVMEMPALRHLRANWPDTHLTALGAHPATELLEGDPVVDALARVQDFGFGHWGDAGTAAARQRAADWVTENAFECVLDAGHTVTGMRQVLQAAGVPMFDTGGPVIPPGDGSGGSAVRSILDSAVHAWGLTEAPREARPQLRIALDAREAMDALLRRRGLEGQERIGIAPVASSHLKRWPLERVCELIRRLAADRPSRILIFGAEDDASAERLRQAAPGRVEIVPMVHLQQTAALIERCHAIVGNDTGLMHIGAAVGTPTVALFGPSSPAVVLPAGATAVSTDTPCDYRHADRLGPPRCILEDRCLIGERSCIERIGVDAVETTLRAQLEPAGAEPVHEQTRGSS